MQHGLIVGCTASYLICQIGFQICLSPILSPPKRSMPHKQPTAQTCFIGQSSTSCDSGTEVLANVAVTACHCLISFYIAGPEEPSPIRDQHGLLPFGTGKFNSKRTVHGALPK